MSKSVTTTLTIAEDGRTTIPKPARKKLGIDGEETAAEVTVKIDD